MWFWKSKNGDKDRQRAPNTRRDQRNEAKTPAMHPALWIPLAGLAALGAGFFITLKLGALLFWENPHYTIRTMDIDVAGPTITPTKVREYLQVSEGTNLFAKSLRTLYTDFLKKSPVAKSVMIQRRVPDTLVVKIVERTPLARVGRGSAMAADREGYVFSLRAGSRDYPVILGSTPEHPLPGARLEPVAMNALEIIDVCARTRLGEEVKIATIDISPKDFLDIYLAAGERVKIAWEGMDRPATENRAVIEKKLQALAAALKNAGLRGRKLASLDLTFGDQYVPGQEY